MLGIGSLANAFPGELQRLIAAWIVFSLAAASVVPSLIAGLEVAPSGQEIVDRISGSRIIATIQDLEEFGSRAFYLNQSNASAQYVYERFAQLGLDVEYQEFMVSSHHVRNVIATLHGTSNSEGVLLFGAHYDSENKLADSYNAGANLSAPGADDDASGVAAVVELATVLSDQHFANTIKFVAFAAEEMGYDDSGGLKGSSHFVEMERNRGVVYAGSAIIDMIGYRGTNGNHVVAVVNSNEDPLSRAILDSVTRNGLSLQLDIDLNASVTWSDHYPFWIAGYPSMLLIEELGGPWEFPVNPYYHSSDDTSGTLSESQMENATKALAGGTLQMTRPLPKDDSGSITVVAGLAVLGAIIIMGFYIRRRKAGQE